MKGVPARYQSGVITTFTGVLILVLLTLMMFFAIRVGVFDQRVSSNEMRQKQAFHAAESGLQAAKEFFRANGAIVASPFDPTLGDGTPGWMAAGNEHWQPCSSGMDPAHPCNAVTNVNVDSVYYWYDDSAVGNPLNVPVNLNVSPNSESLLPRTTEEVEVRAVLCELDIDTEADPPVQGCKLIDNTDPDEEDGTRYLITLVSRGRAGCENRTNCGAEQVITDQVSNFGAAAGGQAPAVPLTTKNMFPPSGAAEVVANPNGGGLGVPISVWMNRNPSCTPDGSAIDPSQGSWGTCEANEWYEMENIPDDVQCPGSCSCSVDETLSDTHGTTDKLGIDLVQDENFPCDLFQFYFGTPKSNYESVKGFAKVLSDCDGLGPSSSGIYWISGASCDINSNAVIGSAHAPVLLISAANVTRMAGGATIFGVLYVSDAENSAASFESQGNNIVYGQVILDAQFGTYNGTFQVVYNENLLTRVAGTGGLGSVAGGWADFQPAAFNAEGWDALP
ncbi:MAG: PilX N-terminal domain-containing pilus assembly protein [Lysobacterales bacterium]|jgi:hypothetical protein